MLCSRSVKKQFTLGYKGKVQSLWPVQSGKWLLDQISVKMLEEALTALISRKKKKNDEGSLQISLENRATMHAGCLALKDVNSTSNFRINCELGQ